MSNSLLPPKYLLNKTILLACSAKKMVELVEGLEALGGKIVVPKMEIAGIGWWAMALDPEGNAFGILESMQK